MKYASNHMNPQNELMRPMPCLQGAWLTKEQLHERHETDIKIKEKVPARYGFDAYVRERWLEPDELIELALKRGFVFLIDPEGERYAYDDSYKTTWEKINTTNNKQHETETKQEKNDN